MSRRQALGAALAGALGMGKLPAVTAAEHPSAIAPHRGRLKQSVCQWPYRKTPLPQLCRRARSMGLVAIDLLYSDEWSIARDAGLVCSMGYASRREDVIERGFNNPANHTMLLDELAEALPKAAGAGVPNLIAMFGNRQPDIDDQLAEENCVAGLKQIAPLAQQFGVTICVELLNSKVDHKGYQGDRTAFGAAVVKQVDSPRVKLLYDIYHMQIMEGDVIRTIREYAAWIGHFHTGGVPGRHEINGTQELNYHAVAAAIADTGYTGYVAHEFNPTRAIPFESLAEAISICTV